MAKKAKKDKFYVIKCSHCFETDFKLCDVDPNDKVKIYTDTPYKIGIFTPGGGYCPSSAEQSHKKNKQLTPCKF